MEKEHKKQQIRPWHVLSVVRNSIDFPLRNLMRWHKPLAESQSADLMTLLSHFPPQIQNDAEGLMQQYRLTDFQQLATFEQLAVNLYYLDLLLQTFSDMAMTWPEDMKAADVGPSDWFYVPALYGFLRYDNNPGGRRLALEGFEVDPYRMYADFHARIDHAEKYIQAFDSITYQTNAFTIQSDAYDLIVQFFPFVFLKDHFAWGLPYALFDPSGLLEKIEMSLKPGALFLVVNQGKAELEQQKELMTRGSLQQVKEFQFHSAYKQYKKDHWVTLWQKQI